MLKFIEDAFKEYTYEVIFVDGDGEEKMTLHCHNSEQFMWAMKLAFQNGFSVYVDAGRKRNEE